MKKIAYNLALLIVFLIHSSAKTSYFENLCIDSFNEIARGLDQNDLIQMLYVNRNINSLTNQYTNSQMDKLLCAVNSFDNTIPFYEQAKIFKQVGQTNNFYRKITEKIGNELFVFTPKKTPIISFLSKHLNSLENPYRIMKLCENKDFQVKIKEALFADSLEEDTYKSIVTDHITSFPSFVVYFQSKLSEKDAFGKFWDEYHEKITQSMENLKNKRAYVHFSPELLGEASLSEDPHHIVVQDKIFNFTQNIEDLITLFAINPDNTLVLNVHDYFVSNDQGLGFDDEDFEIFKGSVQNISLTNIQENVRFFRTCLLCEVTLKKLEFSYFPNVTMIQENFLTGISAEEINIYSLANVLLIRNHFISESNIKEIDMTCFSNTSMVMGGFALYNCSELEKVTCYDFQKKYLEDTLSQPSIKNPNDIEWYVLDSQDMH